MLQTEDQYSLYDDFGLVPSHICNGRLTLTTATPVTTADVTGATTLYFTPFHGNLLSVYFTGWGWVIRKFSELSITLVGLTASKPYDVFVYDNAGTLTLELCVWTNPTTRATNLAWQDGTYVKSGDPTRRYLGTIYINASGGQTNDSLTKRFVWNYYNRLPRKLKVIDATDTWAYTTSTWRSANNSTANRVESIIGVAEDPLNLMAVGSSDNGTSSSRLTGIGINSTSANGADLTDQTAFHLTVGPHHAYIDSIPAIGYSYYQWLEISQATGTTTWYGDGMAGGQAGMIGEVLG
jgi:hypothetical protein